MDTTVLGQTTAALMEALEEGARKEGVEVELGEVLVLAEVRGREDDGSSWTSIAFRCSDSRLWAQRGLLWSALNGEQVADDPADGFGFDGGEPA